MALHSNVTALVYLHLLVLQISWSIAASSAKVEDLTNNRVVVVGTGGDLEDSANLTFDGTTLTANAFSGDGSALTGLGNRNSSNSLLLLVFLH